MTQIDKLIETILRLIEKFVPYIAAYWQGKKAANSKQLKKSNKELKRHAKIDAEYDGLSIDDARERMRQRRLRNAELSKSKRSD
jgi:hypothetical protein